MKLKTTTILIALILLVSFVLAIKPGDITINSPADAVWTNQTNYTNGYNISWTDADANYNATCTLYIGTSNNIALIKATANGSYGTSTVVESEATVLYMNHTFPTNNTLFYWTVECGNASATPQFPTTATTPRSMNQDVTTPTMSIDSIGFVNNTWQSTTPVRMEMTPIDSGALLGGSLNCSIVDFSTPTTAHESETTSNNTAVNVTWTSSDGQYNITGACKDQALNTIVNGTFYTVKIDTTTPVLTHNSPANATVSTVNYILLNWSLTELNLDTIQLEWNGVNETVGTGNCTGTAPAYTCTYNKTGIAAVRRLTYKIYANDSASNIGVSATRTVSVDLASPTVSVIYNLSVSASVATYRISMNETTPASCIGTIYQRNGSTTGNTVTGTLSISTGLSNCSGTVANTDVVYEGDFRMEFNISDDAGNSVLANKTGVYKNLFAGWNMISNTGSSRNTSTFCSEIANCTQVSYINNTRNSGTIFQTYSTSTPSVNNGITLNSGDAVLVYVSANTSYYILDDYLPTTPATGENITLYDGGWNGWGITKDANISAVYNAVTWGTALKNVTYAALRNTSAGKHYTCKRSSNLCAGTSTLATNIPVYKGDAVWALTDLNANYTINRTGVTG
jgi:hypothetical protein